MSRYSHSSIQSYLTCPLKFCYEKVEKIKVDIPSESLHLVLWNGVHWALEFLYKKVSDFQVVSKEELIEDYKRLWDEEIEGIDKRNEKEMFDKETKGVFFNRWVEYLNYYYDTYKPFDKGGVVMKVESGIHFSLTDDINFSGKVDRMDIEGDTITIVDYKTNKSLQQDKSDSIKDQITLYWLGIYNDYWSKIKKVIGRVEYLHLKKVVEWEITEEDIERVKQKYLVVAEEIEKKKEQYGAGKKDVFEPKQNAFCDSCVFKQLCPLYSHYYWWDEKISMGELWETTIRRMIDDYKVINEKYKELESQKKLYSQCLVEYARENNYRKLYGEENKVSITKKIDYGMGDKDKKDELKVKLQELWVLDDVMDIDRHWLARLIKNWEIDLAELDWLVWEKVIEYISRVSKLKDTEGEEIGS